MNIIYTINELKKMSENDRINWIVNAKSYDIDFLLKNAGIKGISKIKKVEKLAMLVKLVEENITDENANCLPEWSSILSLVHRRAICSTEAIAG